MISDVAIMIWLISEATKSVLCLKVAKIAADNAINPTPEMIILCVLLSLLKFSINDSTPINSIHITPYNMTGVNTLLYANQDIAINISAGLSTFSQVLS